MSNLFIVRFNLYAYKTAIAKEGNWRKLNNFWGNSIFSYHFFEMLHIDPTLIFIFI